MNFLYGIILALVGFAFLKYSQQMNNFLILPTMNFFSSGAQAYRTLGLAMIILSPFLLFGIFDLSGSQEAVKPPQATETKPSGIQLPPR